jgi:glutamine cyclotransferase
MMRSVLAIAMIVFLFAGCANNGEKTGTDEPASSPSIPHISYSVTKYFRHDSSLFTEGFVFHEGQLFESSGAPEDLPQTRSVIGISDLKTGKFSPKAEIDRNKYFGEGIVFLHGKLYQLTYKNQVGFIYDAKTFKQTGQFNYANAEGWSLTTDGTSLIMSDGTSNLTYLDAAKLSPVRILKVTEKGYPVDDLNELEFIKGFIYANIWMKDVIMKIDPQSGNVVGKIDLAALTNDARKINPKADVLNGIAYDSTTGKVYVTGKLWANIYEIQFAH